MRARGVDESAAASSTNSRREPLKLELNPNDDSSDTSSQSKSSPTTLAAPAKPSCIAATPRAQELMRRFAHHAYMSYMQGTPALSHLSLLVKYNVSSALQRNAEILGVTAEYHEWEGISPFFKEGPTLGVTSPLEPIEWPVNLHPTQLQRSVEHHPWIDVFPWPKFRDNLLQAFEHPEVCDEDELCHDLVEYSDNLSKPILVVWGDAWDPQSWEVTPEFLRKWGWLLSGCGGFLEPTNHWRAKRGERPITQRELHEAFQLSMPTQLHQTGL
jgi:hypothetical protein